MAVPQELTLPDITGIYAMNKQLSDPVEPLFVLQGVSWFLRTTIGLATITMKMKFYTGEDGVQQLDVASSASGLPESLETRRFDFELRPRKDKVFGNLKGKSRVIKLADYEVIIEGGNAKDIAFLKAGSLEPVAIQGYAESADGQKWRAEQIWSIEEIDGQRRLTQRVVARKGDEVLRLRLVYDYLGKNE